MPVLRVACLPHGASMQMTNAPATACLFDPHANGNVQHQPGCSLDECMLRPGAASTAMYCAAICPVAQVPIHAAQQLTAA